MSLQRIGTSIDVLIDSLTDQNGKVVDIVVRRPDYFVNATRICSSYEKEWTNFRNLPRNQEFISDLQEVEERDVIDTTMTGRQRYTWVHPDLAIELLTWCNRKFKVAATKLIRRFMTGQVTTEESRAAATQLQSIVAQSTSSSHPPPTLTPHQQTRVDSINLHDHLTDVLAAELDRINIPVGHKGMFFAKANDMCNRALLNLNCTTDALKKQRGIPKSLSIPTVCSERQLVDLNMIRMQLANLIRDDSELLTSMTTTDQLDAWFAEKRTMLVRGASHFGYHRRTVDNLLPVADARARSKELAKIRQRYSLPPSTAIALSLPNGSQRTLRTLKSSNILPVSSM
jgi:KilA-N domain